VTIKQISPNEEITFDYAMRNYGVDYFPMKCRYGASECRHTITGWKDSPRKNKKAYEGFVAPYLIELDVKIFSDKGHGKLLKSASA